LFLHYSAGKHSFFSMIALVDCNSCFASMEQIFRPDLRGKPVIVASNNDGCVVTRNAEAKALAIPNLEPLFKIKKIIEKHNVNVFSSNYELYQDISRRLMSLLETFGNQIEVYSVDECFLDVEGFSDLRSHGIAIKKACWKQQRIPVCIGAGKSKTIAKLSNHIAKKSHKLGGVCIIDNLKPWTAVFEKLPVDTVWGVGKQTAKKLNSMSIYSVQDLRTKNPNTIRQQLGIVMERTIRELNNEPCLDFETQPSPKKEIFCSRSFGKKITTLAELEESVANYAFRAAEKLRLQNGQTQRIYVILQSSRFATPYYGNNQSIALPCPSNDSRDIIFAATSLIRKMYRSGFRYARAGVGLLELTGMEHQQGDLFTKNQSAQSLAIMNTLDSINRRYGSGSLFVGAQGTQRTWSMSRSLKSPSYTTRFSDLPVIKI